MDLPKKWTEVYAYGTAEGKEEAAFFKFLARHQKYEYRSIAAIVKGTGLSQTRVEELIHKYSEKTQPPLVYRHPTNDDNWGYWERCINDLPKQEDSLSGADKKKRIDRHISGI